jgi:uncharacterized protein YifN (PemK superfamily)
MAINFKPKVGQILECNFGGYILDAAGAVVKDPAYHLPPEMIKNRLAVVLNSRLNSNACVVVPLSSTYDLQKTLRGVHVEIPSVEIIDLVHFTQCVRWVKADLIQLVSNDRLNRPRTTRGHVEVHLSHDRVGDIQKAVIKVIGAGSLLQPPAAPVSAVP